MTTDNPPAFPRTGEGFGNPQYDTPGMDLRDWFAGQALVGLIDWPMCDDEGFVLPADEREPARAKRAYQIADAMLAARGASS